MRLTTTLLSLRNSKRLFLIVASLCLLCIGPVLRGQNANQPNDPTPYVQAAIKAYQSKDYPALIESMKATLALRPTHQTYMYYLAKGYALTGNKTEALKWLNE